MKKRRRAAAHSHKLRRKDRINKRMLALRNLLPNCTKMDKESILDEAIHYLKSLQFQLQLQIMPNFGGLCVPVSVPATILGAGALQLFGLPFAGYGTKVQMPIYTHLILNIHVSSLDASLSTQEFMY